MTEPDEKGLEAARFAYQEALNFNAFKEGRGHIYRPKDPMKRALTAYLEAVDPWQPIESAPKDGNCLLKIKTDEGFEYAVLERRDDGEWIHDGEPTYCHSYYFEPVEWAPIPTPPKQGA